MFAHSIQTWWWPADCAYSRLREGRPRGGLRCFPEPFLSESPRPLREGTGPMNLLDLLDDPRPFALLRRRTPGRDHHVVEVLLGPVSTYDRLADLPDEGLVLIPYRQIRERG